MVSATFLTVTNRTGKVLHGPCLQQHTGLRLEQSQGSNCHPAPRAQHLKGSRENLCPVLTIVHPHLLPQALELNEPGGAMLLASPHPWVHTAKRGPKRNFGKIQLLPTPVHSLETVQLKQGQKSPEPCLIPRGT